MPWTSRPHRLGARVRSAFNGYDLKRVARFKAVELDRRARRPTGRQELLEGPTRQAAIDALLARLGVAAEAVRLDPSRTMLQVDDGNTWTLIAVATQAQVTEAPSLRRGGAKHRTVR